MSKPTDDTVEAEAWKIIQTTDEIRKQLAGIGRLQQSAVIADLLSMYLSGHIVFDERVSPFAVDREKTDKAREEVLTIFLELVRNLLVPNETRVLELFRKGILKKTEET